MKIKKIIEYTGAVLTSTWLADFFLNYYSAYVLLVLLMVIDYISGMLASYKEAIDNPNDPNYGWSSKKGLNGIIKKIGYLLTNIVALCMDYILRTFSGELGIEVKSSTTIALVVLVWFILNELLSITENTARLGVPVPKFLLNILSDLRQNLDDKKK
ncbi:toxin secretion/phage lysis holin [Butyrivibrio hungatei DSM 14810]|uniref:Toxin secretion/phage lysis holin n=1 Tax=Butyrivibrio hungatei DSM 14810 TaxID=1121132 RepID=A0A1M7SU61_9FIRM|nr:phage holin family protein [Butyrivibrio hungatei]SHN61992.1 toxin secretion/phage lysis holin [Butyrivibrio hungatei DSM 14810]